jgi:septum formation protein
MRTLERVILASASPRRLELLRSLGLDVTVILSDYHEPPIEGLTPPELATAHARAKLESVRVCHPELVEEAPIVAADTVVDVDGRALGKPRDGHEATRMLELLSGREHEVHTAFALSIAGSPTVEERETTRVRFHRLSADEIAEYVASGEPMDKAGAYGIQGRAASLIAGIDGDFYTVMGFPLGRFVRTLRRLGLSVPTAKVEA